MATMSEAQWRAFLGTGSRTGKLATVTADGTPTVNPIWFVLDGDDVVFTTFHTSAKAGHLKRLGHAALCVDDEGFPFSYVLVRGPVTITEDDPDRPVLSRRLAERYMPADRVDATAARNDVAGEWVCRLRCERVRAIAGVAD